MKASTIQTFGISREFNGITVLNDINLALESGKIYGLIGRNGSGKTVLMKIICGFLMPSKGYVLINGRKLGKDIDFPENTGIIIEAPTFLAHLNAYQNLKNLADIRGIIGPDEIRQSISLFIYKYLLICTVQGGIKMGCPPAHTASGRHFCRSDAVSNPLIKEYVRIEGRVICSPSMESVTGRQPLSVPYVFSSGKYSPDSVGRCGSSTQRV